MNKKSRMILAGAGVILALAACTGPETRVLPRQNILPEEPYELTGTESVLEEANPFYLQEALDFLARTPRECGSDAETNAAEYIKRLLIEYGYEVTLQSFPFGDGVQERYGTNVIAAKQGKQKTGDIVLVAASHDTAAGSPGANANASGVVALLETARLISKIPTDTEILFVSFSEIGQQRLGTHYYLESLTEEERNHIIGVLYLDTLGYIYDNTMILGSIDGRPTMLGDYLNETVKSEFNDIWKYHRDDTGSSTVFNAYRIPAVRVAQTMTAFEEGTPQDRSDIVDVERLGEVSWVISQTLTNIMSEETESYLEASQAGEYRRDGALLQRTDRSVPFGQSKKQVGAYYGSSGTLIETMENGDSIYQYPVKWLGVDQIILSDFYYKEDVLEEITLAAAEAGIEVGEMKERLNSLYGEGQITDEEGQVQRQWNDTLGNLLFIMTETEDSFTVRIRKREPQILELTRYSVNQMAGRELPTVQMKAAAELAEQILTPVMREQVETIVLFTDGIGGQTVYWQGSDLAGLVLYLDLADAADQEGNYRDYNESCRQLVNACAYFYEQKHAAAFQEQFPESEIRDFYAAFQYFVLSRQPDSDMTEADAKTMFFYGDGEMTEARNEIRNQLGWNEYE